MSVEQDIMTQVLANFNNISIANGYSFDINGHVYEWRDSDIPESIIRAIVVRDIHEEIVDQDDQMHRLELEITAFAYGNTGPALIRAMKQDILTAFSLIKTQLSIMDAEYISSDMI